MRKHTFALWLQNEVHTARFALLSAYEQYDRLRYQEGPKLEQAYMAKIGEYENEVIREEIECEVLQKKQKMIQIALNMNAPVDEAKIDAELEEYRKQLIQEAIGLPEPRGGTGMTQEEMDELQKLYREIVRSFHPQTNPDLTEVHRQLFQKAQDAYRSGDLDALKLIHGMLFSASEDTAMLDLLLKLLSADGTSKTNSEPVEIQATDYSLAAVIFDSFKPTADEAAIRNEWVEYQKKTEGVLESIEHTRQSFPFTTAKMMADPQEIKAYKEELNHRMHAAITEQKQLKQKIRTLLERVAVHG